MQFLILTRRLSERFPESEFATRLDAEVAQAKVLYAEGFFRQLWHRRDIAGACILVESDSEEHVRERLDTLPLFRAGMLDVSIIPLKPYAGFCPPSPKATAGKPETPQATVGKPEAPKPSAVNDDGLPQGEGGRTSV